MRGKRVIEALFIAVVVLPVLVRIIALVIKYIF
jgi:hypothetical protein